MNAWTCLCSAVNTGSQCEQCGREILQAPVATTTPLCETCHMPTRLLSLMPGEDGVRRCASCHIVYLKLRAAKSDDDHCIEPACTRTVGEHRAELRRLLGILESRVMAKTAEMVRL